jgi:hypothetical protein
VRPTGPSTSSLPPCTTGHLTLRVVKGASANQQAFATLVLHNTGSACSLIGFPGVTLLLGGKRVGPDAARSSVGYSAVDVPAGGDAHAQLSVLTSCNADRSDTVRVIPPNQTTSLTAPLAVYACQSQISPMQPGAA